MVHVIYSKGAVFSVLFCACLLALPAAAGTCPPRQVDETARVRHVHDGDTLKLTDGRKIRLIGIDTPELARDHRGQPLPAQPYAREARTALIRLLESADNRVSLAYGRQRHDRYRRTLAHLYLPDGSSVQAHLLSRGLATAFTTPPNDTRSPCYRAAESVAMERRAGIWSLPRYQLKTLYQLRPTDNGFRRIKGRVSDVRFTDKAVWIELGDALRLRINNKDLVNFNEYALKQLPGKDIQVRGWLHPKKKHFFMALRHSDALIIQ